MSTIIQSTQVTKSRTQLELPEGVSQKLTDKQFVSRITSILDEGLKKGHSTLYVADQIHKVAHENPDAARSHMMSDYASIKAGVEFVYMTSERGDAPKEKVGKRPEEGRKKGFNIKKTGECLVGKVTTIIPSAARCAADIIGSSKLKALTSCASVVAETAECVKKGFDD